jgi:RES domain-containing protein
MSRRIIAQEQHLPPNQHFVTIAIPAGVSYETVAKHSLPRWDDGDGATSREFGTAWFTETRTVILIVPSFVSREECNVLINPNHARSARIKPGRAQPVRWDQRLFVD